MLMALCASISCSQVDNNNGITLTDLEWEASSPASMIELNIPSDSALLQGFMYKANGEEKHPTLLLLHGYPGNERNLDIGQVARANGWNVVYFNYRGAWGSQGKFSIKNAVEDVINTVNWLTTQEALQVDPTNMVLFGHSLGAFICLKAIQELPSVTKGFALSTFDIYGSLKGFSSMDEIMAALESGGAANYFVLNTPARTIFTPVVEDPTYFDLTQDYETLKNKRILMLDEHARNAHIAQVLMKDNPNFLKYDVWETDHSFTNKRVSLIKEVMAFIED